MEDYSAGLTKIQRAAVEWDDGPLLVLAGPGSGKTRVLTARIARLCQMDGRWRVLALTFTNRAADEMRGRLLNLAPGSESRTFIGTFHSFATEILRQNGTAVGIDTDFKIYTSFDDRVRLLSEAIKNKKIEGEFQASKLLPVLDRLRDRLAKPESIAPMFRDKAAGERVARAFIAFEEYQRSANVVDVTGLIYHAHSLLAKFPTLANKFRHTYKYICVDEFQDTNGAQYQLLKSLAREGTANLMVVADDDQIIYQWNGASHRRIEQFVADFSPEKIQIPTNFRCPPVIVDLANRLVANNHLRAPWKSPTIAGRADDSEGVVKLVGFASDGEEYSWVAKDVRSRYQMRAYEGVVVLARNKSVLEGLKAALDEQGVPSLIAQRRDQFLSIPFLWLDALLRISARRSDEAYLERFVSSGNRFLGSNSESATIISCSESTFGDYLRAWYGDVQNAVVPPKSSELIDLIGSYLTEEISFRSLIDEVVAKFRLWQAELEGQFASVDEDFSAWTELQREIQQCLGRSYGIDEFLQELDMRSKEPPRRHGILPLLTIHGSKGNEFDHVYIAGVAEDILPSFQSIRAGSNSPEMEEERRNCFVAITRSKCTLVLSCAGQYRGWKKAPSRFLAEMGLTPLIDP